MKIQFVNQWRKTNAKSLLHIAMIGVQNYIKIFYFVILGIGFIIRIKPEKL